MDFVSLLTIVTVVISGGILCVQDWKTLSVSVFPLVIFTIGCFSWWWNHGEYSFYLFAITLLIDLFAKIFLKKNLFGIADYLIIIAVSPFLCNSETSILLILIGTIGIFASILRKDKIIPFVPAIIFSVLILRLTNGLE